MNWRCKALVQLALSSIPKGEYLNYLLQRFVTRSIPASEVGFMAAVSYAHRHMDALRPYLSRPLADAVFFEFGAGWDITIPLTYYGLGAEHQILVDIRRLLQIEVVNDTIRKYQTTPCDLGIARRPANYLNGRQRDLTIILNKYYGIHYRAPCDARQTGLQSRLIDCITSTSTLEHIPPADIISILRECHRILRDDGLMTVLINYDDHYSYFDTTISGYNFLQYSDRIWALFNPPLHYQNRLRHRDYIALFQSEGFSIVEDQHKRMTETDLKTLQRLSVDARFRNYSSDDLAVHNALFVLRKRPVVVDQPFGSPISESSAN